MGIVDDDLYGVPGRFVSAVAVAAQDHPESGDVGDLGGAWERGHPHVDDVARSVVDDAVDAAVLPAR